MARAGCARGGAGGTSARLGARVQRGRRKAVEDAAGPVLSEELFPALGPSPARKELEPSIGASTAHKEVEQETSHGDLWRGVQ